MTHETWHLAVRPTPLHQRMAEFNISNQWTQHLGWTLAESFDGPAAEHAALRNRCVFSDRTALVTYRITGPQAADYLNQLAGGCGGRVRQGASRQVALCDDHGGLIADGVVLRPAADEWLLTLPVRALDWLEDSAAGLQCNVCDISEEIATIAFDGPASCAALLSAGFGGLQAMRPGDVRQIEYATTAVTVARTSPLGGLGYELRIPADDALWILGRIQRGAEFFRPVPMGTAAQALAQLEAGHPREGVDYESATTASQVNRRTVLELGFSRLIDMSSASFNGKQALQRQSDEGAEFAMVGLEIEGEHEPVSPLLYADDRPIGTLTSVAWSPSRKRVIALGDIQATELGGDGRFQATGPKGLPLNTRIVPRPFFVCINARRTPPDAA